MISIFSRGLAAAALTAGLCFATAAAAQDSGGPLSVFDRMFGRNAPASTPDQSSQDISQAPATELVMRIERLEAQIRQMTGTIEQLQYRNQQLEAQLRNAGANVAAAAPPAQQVQPQPIQQARPPSQAAQPPAVEGRRSDAFDPTQQPGAPGAPRTLGSVSSDPPAVIAADPPVGVPGGRGAGTPLDLATLSANAAAESRQPSPPGALPAPPPRNPNATGPVAAVAPVAPPTETSKDYYDLAYGYVMRKDYAQAETGFQAFLQKFPTDRRAADAQFWLGESLFQRQRYDAAAQAFLDLSTKHKGHAKAPDALLRLAQSLAALKQKEMACATLAEIERKYPRASNSVKQGVEREQKRVSC